MKLKTKITGYRKVRGPGGNLTPFELTIDGHIEPDVAFDIGVREGMDGTAYVTVRHEVVGLPVWAKHLPDDDKFYLRSGPGMVAS